MQHENYTILEAIIPEILNGKARFQKLSAGENFMPLHVDLLDYSGTQGRIALAHNYIQNGDLMADPDMEITFDKATKTAQAQTYQQDNGGIYQSVNTGDATLAKELDSFLNTWLRNIQEQGFRLQESHITHKDHDLVLFYASSGQVEKISGDVKAVQDYKTENTAQLKPAAPQR